MTGVFGGVGRLEFAPTNAPDDPFPTYVDITAFVRAEDSPLSITRGRQTELDTIQSSQLTCVLDNTDNRFTAGLLTGPYGANWTAGKKIRYSETIGSRTFVLFTGYIEAPDIEEWQPIGYQAVHLSALDRLTRLSRTAPFVSTLSDQVRVAGGSSLAAWWPLNDLNGASLSAGVGPLLQVTNYNDVVTNSQLAWQDRPGPVGDDVPYVQMTPTPAVIAANYTGAPRLARRDLSVSLAAGNTVAIICWIYIPVDATQPTGPGQVLISHANLFNPPTFTLSAVIGTGWSFQCSTTSGVKTVTVSQVKTNSWSMISMFLETNTGNVTLCVNGQVATDSIGLPVSGTLQEIALDGLNGQSFAHLQMYAGPSAALGRAFHTAQYQMGLTGLEYQATGSRIGTILDYAGVPTGERSIDPGVTFVSKALLANTDPGTQLQLAVDTERGRGFIDGTGRYVFQDRTRTLNV